MFSESEGCRWRVVRYWFNKSVGVVSIRLEIQLGSNMMIVWRGGIWAVHVEGSYCLKRVPRIVVDDSCLVW